MLPPTSDVSHSARIRDGDGEISRFSVTSTVPVTRQNVFIRWALRLELPPVMLSDGVGVGVGVGVGAGIGFGVGSVGMGVGVVAGEESEPPHAVAAPAMAMTSRPQKRALGAPAGNIESSLGPYPGFPI